MPSRKHRHPAPRRQARRPWNLKRVSVLRINKKFIPRNLHRVLQLEEEGFLILRVS